jgi:2-C-methyl-D-erythritol 4-phosphate cytidylyltransferase
MVKDVFDTPPQGMIRTGKRGWIVPAQTPQLLKTNKIRKENEELKQRLSDLEELVNGLVSKKVKK